MKAKIIKTEPYTDGVSCQIRFNKNMIVWFDAYQTDDGITGDWNKYIFYTTDSDDMKIKKFQEDSNNYSLALELCDEFISNQK